MENGKEEQSNNVEKNDINKQLEKIEKILIDQTNKPEALSLQTLNQIDKRVTDAKNLPTVVISASAVMVAVCTIFIIGLGLFFAFNLQAEKARLREIQVEMKDEIDTARQELKNDITAAFQKGIKKPNIVLFADIGTPLEGQTILVKKEPSTTKKHEVRVKIPIIFKNEGEGTTSPIFTKIYLSKDLKTGSPSSDEKEYAYEAIFPPEDLPFKPPILPAGVSIQFSAGFNLTVLNKKLDKFPMLIKVYYGGDSPHIAKFFIKLADQT